MGKPKDLNKGLSFEELRNVLSYNKDTGKFFWNISRNQNVSVGSEAGYIESKTGYVRITVNGHVFMAHRLAWLYVNGEWPPDRIDHINTIRSDNRWSNLRQACDPENAHNRKRQRNNSGFKGVELHSCGQYRARIFLNKRHIHLGLFPTAELAHAAYIEAAKAHFGTFARSE